MIEHLYNIDERIFEYIHLEVQNNFLDALIPYFREPLFWSPIYIFLLFFMLKNYKLNGLFWCLFFLLTFAYCDLISASVLKPFFHRARPCQITHLDFSIRELVRCGSGFSFPSSHASNHFGLSFFMYFTLGKKYNFLKPLVIFWAILVCFSQIYVGVHYPSDIIGGAVLGIFIGSLMSYFFNRKYTI